MEQVFPETPFGYRLLQVLIGSGYQTDVRLNLLFTAYGAVAFFLQGTQQCPLYLGIQIAHLVQKRYLILSGKHWNVREGTAIQNKNSIQAKALWH